MTNERKRLNCPTCGSHGRELTFEKIDRWSERVGIAVARALTLMREGARAGDAVDRACAEQNFVITWSAEWMLVRQIVRTYESQEDFRVEMQKKFAEENEALKRRER